MKRYAQLVHLPPLTRRTTRVAFLFLLVALEAGILFASRHHYGHPLPPQHTPDLANLGNQLSGYVAYELRDAPGQSPDIRITRIPDGQTRRLFSGGYCPRFSPDGQRLACLRESGDAISVVRLRGYRPRTYTDGISGARSLTWAPDGREIWFADGRRVQALRLTDGNVRLLASVPAVEIDSASNGRELIYSCSDHYQYHVPLDTGNATVLCRGCSSSLSPDGTRFISNRGGHRHLWIRHFPDGDMVADLPSPPGQTFDNQFWSNHSDWIVSRTEQGGKSNVWVHRVSDGHRWRVTDGGIADRPDLWVDSPSAD